jgi:hypothetical protein
VDVTRRKRGKPTVGRMKKILDAMAETGMEE